MKIEDLNVQLSVSITADRALSVNKKADELKTSKRCVIEEMIDYCTKNDVLRGKKKPRRARSSNIDHKKTIIDAWETGSRMMADGEKCIYSDDVKKFFVALGKTEATAAQYCTKKIPQNPFYTGMSEGWLIPKNGGYVIKIKRLETMEEVKNAVSEDKFGELSAKIGLVNISGMNKQQKDAAYVAAYYEEAGK